MTLENIWEAIKTPLRQALLFLYAWVLNSMFDKVALWFGFAFTEEQKIQLMGYGTPIVWAILAFLDKYMHEIGKAKEDTSTKKVEVTSLLTTGLTRF
jgi:hypothetical protein